MVILTILIVLNILNTLNFLSYPDYPDILNYTENMLTIFGQEHHSEHRLLVRLPGPGPPRRVLPWAAGEEEEESGRRLGQSWSRSGGLAWHCQEEKVEKTLNSHFSQEEKVE